MCGCLPFREKDQKPQMANASAFLGKTFLVLFGFGGHSLCKTPSLPKIDSTAKTLHLDKEAELYAAIALAS
jgi:hypothetical protein